MIKGRKHVKTGRSTANKPLSTSRLSNSVRKHIDDDWLNYYCASMEFKRDYWRMHLSVEFKKDYGHARYRSRE